MEKFLLLNEYEDDSFDCYRPFGDKDYTPVLNTTRKKSIKFSTKNIGFSDKHETKTLQPPLYLTFRIKG